MKLHFFFRFFLFFVFGLLVSCNKEKTIDDYRKNHVGNYSLVCYGTQLSPPAPANQPYPIDTTIRDIKVEVLEEHTFDEESQSGQILIDGYQSIISLDVAGKVKFAGMAGILYHHRQGEFYAQDSIGFYIVNQEFGQYQDNCKGVKID